MSGRKKKVQPGTPESIIRAILWGVLAGAAGAVVPLCLFSGVMAKGGLPFFLIDALMIISLALGGFLGGFVSSRILREQGIVWGMLTGGILFLIVFLAGFIISGAEFSLILPVKLFAMLLCGAVGGILGVNVRVRG